MLAAHELAYERHFRPVFAPLDLAVNPGGLLLVTGANGSGKTTLLRLLAGILRPHGGRVDNRASGTLWLGHQLALKDDLTVRENLLFNRRFAGASRDVDLAIGKVGLAAAAQQPARSLSAGQRKRCALARLLLTRASLWLLDEPYSNLDREGMTLVDALLGEHLAGGGACVLATHGELRRVGAAVTELTLTPVGAAA